MPPIKQKSKPALTTLVLGALLATMAIFPATGLAAPEGGEEPQPQLAFEPGGYDFGLRQVDSGGDQANFQLRNIGAGEVRIDTVNIAGAGAEAFWLGYDNCGGQTLQPGQTCSAGVNFNPHAATAYSAQLQANAGGQLFTAGLSGSGGRAEVGTAANPTDFGVAKVGSEGTIHEITVSNSGNLPAGFFIAVISGGAVGSYQLLDENCTGHLLMPSSSCTVQVRFQPLSMGVKMATLSLFGDQDGGAQIGLTGVGAEPDPGLGQSSPGTDPGPASTATGFLARPRAKSHRRRPRSHGRNRRVALDASRVLTRAK
jgi:hypothetical protein